ncbi:MAG: DUF4390 domain-containing protein [Rhodocyclaceae bacterium]|nr:DUF4390 domain-containing protein [Rhodocyclaceae bacterium]
MTVSSTPRSSRCLPAADRLWALVALRPAKGRALALAVALLLTVVPAVAADPPTPSAAPAQAGAPTISAAAAPGTPQLRREDNGWELTTDLDLQLSPTLESALQRGLPLYFTLRLQITRPRWYWLDAEVVDVRRDYRVSYHALTRQYRVASGALGLSYPTLAEAMRAVASVHGWAVAESSRLKAGERYRARLALRLDGSRLPKPFQINLLGPAEWSTDVETEWEFTP